MRCRVMLIIVSAALILAGCAAPAGPGPSITPAPDEPVESIMDNTAEEIHINQLGYRPGDIKTVRIPGEHTVFFVMDCDTGQSVYEGCFDSPVRDRGAEEDVSGGDFSALDTPGRYVIQVPQVGHSYAFTIADGVYAGLNTAVLKMLYYQRCGVALTDMYAGQWSRPACHTGPGEVYGEEGVFDGTGGWHDAGDYGKYTVPAARTVADLFLAYGLYPGAFGDGTGIPESGNGVPDILDEARVGLDWLLKMQDTATGGVYHKYTSRGFPGMDVMPQHDFSKVYAITISPTATGSFCAVTAHAARIYADIDADFAARCLDASRAAYAWMQANPNAAAFANPPDVNTGDYRDVGSRDECYWAGMELYVTTGDTAYLDDALSFFDPQTALYWSDTLELYDVSLLGTFSYLLADRADAASEIYLTLYGSVISAADGIAARGAQNGYGIDMGPEDYVWGSNMLVSNRAVVLLFANHISPDESYVRTARAHFDYLLGCNALGQCFVTGFGAKRILYPHHRPTVADRIMEPIPGMVSGGPNNHMEDDVARGGLDINAPPAKCFLDEIYAYSLNEVTTYWNSPVVLLSAFFNGENE